MRSLLDGEFVACGNIGLDELQDSIVKKCQDNNVPVATKIDSVKSGFLAKDSCLVLYHPQNLDYHTQVLVIRDVNNTRMLSIYSAGTAKAHHIGGGMLNVDHQANKIRGLVKSSKQKEAEAKAYYGQLSDCVGLALDYFGLYKVED